jgi:penicillin G amidase
MCISLRHECPKGKMKRLILIGLATLWTVQVLPAPKPVATSAETVQLEGQAVKILRDAYGVPRVFAATLQGLFAGDGYAVAEDRAWQLEMYRLDAEGRLAQVYGKRFVDRDEEVRRDGLTREELREEFTQLPPRDQEILRAYATGMNGFFAHAERTDSLPSEFDKYGVHAEPWTVEDSMAIMAMMSRRFGGSGVDQLQNEAAIQYLTHRLGERKAMEVFNDLAWENDPAAIPTIVATHVAESESPESSSKGPAGGGRSLDGGSKSMFDAGGGREPGTAFLNRLDDEANSTAVFAAARQLGLAKRWGSYTWVISPQKSVSGHAMLLGGPQMGFTTPQIAHEIQLTGAGFDVIGMDFAGIPGVLIGSNRHLAWTSTSGESHNEDVFVEKLKPGDPHQYFYRGAWRPMEHRVERILVKGSPPLSYDLYRTVHGPVIGWSPDRMLAYSKGMTYFGKEYRNIIGFLGLNTAERIQDVPPLCKDITSNHNIIVATQSGDIGFWHCGLFPVYPSGVDPRLPLRGTGQDDWLGFVPFDRIPQEVNPKTGIIFNWNNKPAPGWKNYSVPAWGIVFRISNIRNAIARRLERNGGKLSFTQLLAVAPEIGRHNFRADYLKPGLIAAAAHHPSEVTPDMKKALAYLEHWDDEARQDGIAQTIFEGWYERLRQDLFRPVVGDLGGSKNFSRFINASSVYHALAGTRSSVKLSYDCLAGRNVQTVELQAFREAVQQLERERGAEMSNWEFQFPWISFDPLPSIPWYSRGTYIQAVELDPAGVHGVWILPPGESENPESPHFRDQLYLAGWWMYTPMRLMSPY